MTVYKVTKIVEHESLSALFFAELHNEEGFITDNESGVTSITVEVVG